MRTEFWFNGNFAKITLFPDNATEKSLLEAFRSSTMPHITIGRPASGGEGTAITRRATAPPDEETGNIV